ncbi:MAG: carboxypeptidase regulatory-like domain-containing protein [Phycisphaerae bacterium]|nr:carboxypeptidase regulatory-like domain-containing protein [Saprospiraceae bacterium]
MNTRLFLLLFTLTSCTGILSAQTKVRIRVLDENDQPLKFVRLTLSGTSLPIETQSNGEYNLEFPPGKVEIVFYPPAGYERISPPNGALVMPEDKSRTIDIWLARKGVDNRELETFARVLSKKEEEKARLKIENEKIKARLAKLESEQGNTRALRDSIETIVRKNTGNEAALAREIGDLKEAVGLKQQLFYKKISGELIVYTDRLKDLRDALPRVRDAFIDNRSMARFDKIIAAYNIARDSLLQNHRGHSEIVRALWGAPAADALTKVYEQTLTAVHQQTVLPLNTSLLDQFRAVRAEEVRPVKARKKAEKSANQTFEKLNILIPSLESNIRVVLSQLEAALHQNH